VDKQNEKKKVDESWKDSVEKEKSSDNKEGGFAPPEADFNLFVTSMALQASIALGIVANPSTGKKESNLSQAKFLIDTLAMLQEKTSGNLSEEEGRLLENALYELRLQYVENNK